jgi:hypothetical protein
LQTGCHQRALIDQMSTRTRSAIVTDKKESGLISTNSGISSISLSLQKFKLALVLVSGLDCSRALHLAPEPRPNTVKHGKSRDLWGCYYADSKAQGGGFSMQQAPLMLGAGLGLISCCFVSFCSVNSFSF